MAIIKQAKNIVIEVHNKSSIFVKEKMSKTSKKMVIRTTEGNIKLIAAKHLKINSNGD